MSKNDLSESSMGLPGGRRLKPAYRTLENENAGFGFNPIEDSLARGDLNIFRRLGPSRLSILLENY
jgi:hypothetical protein